MDGRGKCTRAPLLRTRNRGSDCCSRYWRHQRLDKQRCSHNSSGDQANRLPSEVTGSVTQDPYADAIAMSRQGRIVSVGSVAQVESHTSAEAARVNIEGCWIVPVSACHRFTFTPRACSACRAPDRQPLPTQQAVPSDRTTLSWTRLCGNHGAGCHLEKKPA